MTGRTAVAGDDQPQYPRRSCEACGAPMIWAVTEAGDRVCVDADPVALNGGGGDTKLVWRGAGVPPLAKTYRNPAQLFGAKAVFRRHITTCPHAKHYRNAARRRRA